MGTDVSAPQPTAEQARLEELSLEQAERSIKQQRALEPLIMAEMGLKFGDEGQVTKMSDEERLAGMSASERLAYENAQAQQERLSRALAGELPVSEGTGQQREEEWSELQNLLEAKGTTGTARIQAEDDFNRRWDARVDAERRGELTAGSQLAFSGLGFVEDLAAQNVATFAGAPSLSYPTTSAAYQFSQPSGFQQMGFQSDVMSAQNRASIISGGLGGAGFAAGGYFG